VERSGIPAGLERGEWHDDGANIHMWIIGFSGKARRRKKVESDQIASDVSL
jgi:hypothetical protein